MNINDYKKYISGGLSGIIEVSLTHPLDYIKTKKQEYTQREITNNNFYKYLLKENKVNLYRGIFPRIVGVIPMRFVFWGVQDNSYQYFNQYNYSKFYCGVFAGITGGGCQTLIDNLIEMFKIKTMTNQKINMSDLIQNKGFFCDII